MVLGIGVTSNIAHPNIKASISKDVCKTLILKISEPIGTGCDQTMLKEEDWAWSWRALKDSDRGERGRERERERERKRERSVLVYRLTTY